MTAGSMPVHDWGNACSKPLMQPAICTFKILIPDDRSLTLLNEVVLALDVSESGTNQSRLSQ